MLETKDPAIKLFGRKIQLLADDEAPVIESDGLGGDTAVNLQGKAEQEEVTRKETEATDSDNSPSQESIPDSNSDNPKTPTIDEETSKPNNSKTEKEQSDSNNSKETNNKTLKKPDKILPCPRCNSMETKFCYYNNYNVNQPRHFCKACQRYWTAGGSMRNVPVGAGRRKTKNSSSTTSLFHHQVSIPEALQKEKNGQVLSFSTSLELDDAPICDSMASMLNLADMKKNSNVLNPCCKTRDDCSSVTDSIDKGGRKCAEEPPSSNGLFPSQVPCIPWPYPWNSAGPTPGFCPPNIPVSFYPSGYWIPWFSQQPTSPTSLGKHSRECDVREEPSPKHKAGNVLVPKTLRIDDPNEAAKSSIWATLGIKNDSVNGGELFKHFQSKRDEKNLLVESSLVLRANPAALSRSLKFQESS